MRSYRAWRGVDLDQDEPGRIVLLLDHGKARDTGLLNTRTGVFNRGLPEVSN